MVWNNGKVTLKGGRQKAGQTVFDDVEFSLNRFSSAGQMENESTRFSFRARDIGTKPIMEISTEGILDTGAILNGKMNIKGFDPARHSRMFPHSPFTFEKGRADITFQYEYAGQMGIERNSTPGRDRISNGTFTAKKFLLTKNSEKAVFGDTLSCRKFSFDMQSRTVLCDQLEVLKGTIDTRKLFSGSGEQKVGTSNSWHILVNDLQLSGSSVRLPLQGNSVKGKREELVLQDVQLDATGLQEEGKEDNIKASARLGKKGKMSVSGSYSSQSGSGVMQLDLEDIDLSLLRPYFTPWYVPQVNGGTLGAKGVLQMPGGVFRGMVQLDDFESGDENGAKLSWSSAVAGNSIFRHNPPGFESEELVINKPSLKPGISSGELFLKRFLSLKDDILPPSFKIGKILIEDGISWLPEPVFYPGYQPMLQNVNGVVSPGETNERNVIVEGTISQQGRFKLRGNVSPTAVRSYTLDMQDFPLQPFYPVLLKEFGAKAQFPLVSWKQEMNLADDTWGVTTQIRFQDVVPDPDAKAFKTLALLIGKDRTIEMEIKGSYSPEAVPFLLEQCLKQLRHLEVKATISPRLLIKISFPELNLAESVPFKPGTAEINGEMPPLTGYTELLKMRPYLALRLSGQYDPVADGEVVQAELQALADRQRQEENRRRALEKVRILQEEKRKAKKMQEKGPGVTVEEIPQSELARDLDPLPRVTVKVEQAQLSELAGKRVLVLYDYLVDQLHIEPGRVAIDKNRAKGAAGVRIDLKPFMPSDGETEQ